jgi:hypothetical protein
MALRLDGLFGFCGLQGCDLKVEGMTFEAVHSIPHVSTRWKPHAENNRTEAGGSGVAETLFGSVLSSDKHLEVSQLATAF